MKECRASWLQLGIVIALVFFSAAFLLYTLAFYGYLNPEGRACVFLFDLLPVIAATFSVAAVLALLRNFRKGDPPRLIWRLILVSLVLDLGAEFTWFVYEVLAGTEVPYPSLADALWLAAYPPFIVALALVITGSRKLGLPMRKGYAAASLALIIGILVAITLLVTRPIFTDAEASLLDKAINPAYVYLDFALLALALVVAMTFSGGPHGGQWFLLSSAFMFFSVADIIFAYLSWQGLYSSGNHIDLLWLCGYLLMGIAALNQREILLQEKVRFVA